MCLLIFFFLFSLSLSLSLSHKATWSRRMAVATHIDGYFGRNRPYRLVSAISACFGGRFDRIGSRFHWNRRESAPFWPKLARIWPSLGKSKKKKGGGESASRMLDIASGRIGLWCSDLGAASMLSRCRQ